MRAAAAALRQDDGCLLWAVHVGRGEKVWLGRCDAANGSKEPILWKTPCCERSKLGFGSSASAFLIRLFAFAAVQEGSWRVCGDFGRLQRVGIRLLRRLAGEGAGSLAA